MKLLRHVGTVGYGGGWDAGAERMLGAVMPGQACTVSDEKAAQLMADFPGDWQDLGVSPDMAAAETADNVIGPQDPIPVRKPARARRTK